MYIVAFSIGFLFWKSCKSWRRLGALDYIWKSGVGFTLFYFTNLFRGNSWKKGVRHHDFYSELVLWGVGHGCFYFILAGLLPPLVAPHGDSKSLLYRYVEIMYYYVPHFPYESPCSGTSWKNTDSFVEYLDYWIRHQCSSLPISVPRVHVYHTLWPGHSISSF